MFQNVITSTSGTFNVLYLKRTLLHSSVYYNISNADKATLCDKFSTKLIQRLGESLWERETDVNYNGRFSVTLTVSVAHSRRRTIRLLPRYIGYLL